MGRGLKTGKNVRTSLWMTLFVFIACYHFGQFVSVDNMFEVASKLVKKSAILQESWPKRADLSAFCDLVFSNSSCSNGQNVAPPNGKCLRTSLAQTKQENI